nr:PREDICTED: uncharacterized protein LOC109037648 [Bemisia tabaci]
MGNIDSGVHQTDAQNCSSQPSFVRDPYPSKPLANAIDNREFQFLAGANVRPLFDFVSPWTTLESCRDRLKSPKNGRGCWCLKDLHCGGGCECRSWRRASGVADHLDTWTGATLIATFSTSKTVSD